jgi:hypothetical protein
MQHNTTGIVRTFDSSADAYDASQTGDQAARIGREHGTSAATWVFNGNTPDDDYARVVRLADEGDPALYDMYREPDLSGDYADGLV